MKHTAFQHIIASDVPKGAKISPNQWGIAEGASFSSILLSIGQRESKGVSIPIAEPQVSPPLFNAPQQKPLFYLDGKPALVNVLPGTKTHKENPLDSIPFHGKSPVLYRKAQWGRNLGDEISNTAQQAILPIPASIIINDPLADRPLIKYSMTSPQRYEVPEISADSSSHTQIAVMPATKNVTANPYSTILLNVNRAKHFQSQPAEMSQSSIPKPSTPELFGIQENNTGTKQMKAALPGPITGSRQAESIIFTARADVMLLNSVGQTATSSFSGNASPPEPEQASIAPSIPELSPKINNSTNTSNDVPITRNLDTVGESGIAVPSGLENPDYRLVGTSSLPIVLSGSEDPDYQLMEASSLPKTETFQPRQVNLPAAPNISLAAEPKVGLSSRREPPVVLTNNIAPMSLSNPTNREHSTAPDNRIVEGAVSSEPIQESRYTSSKSPMPRSMDTPDEVFTVRDISALASKLGEEISLSVEVRTNTPESSPVMNRGITGILPDEEMPTQNNIEQSIPDNPASQHSELATAGTISASVELPGVAIETTESAPAMINGAVNNVSEREMVTPQNMKQPVPDAPVFQRSEITTSESVGFSTEVPEMTAETPVPSPMTIGDVLNTASVLEMSAQNYPDQSVSDTPRLQHRELATGEAIRASSGSPEATVESSVSSPAVYRSITEAAPDREIPMQHNPERLILLANSSTEAEKFRPSTIIKFSPTNGRDFPTPTELSTVVKSPPTDSRGFPTPTEQQFLARQQHQEFAPGTYAFQRRELANNENTRASIEEAEPTPVTIRKEIPLQSSRGQILPDTSVFQLNKLANSEILGTQAPTDIPEPATVVVSDVPKTASAMEMPTQRNPEQPVPDTNTIHRAELTAKVVARSSVEAPIDASESEPVATSDTSKIASAMEMPAQRNLEQPVPDIHTIKRDEPTANVVTRSSVEASIDTHEPAPVAVGDAPNSASAMEMSAQWNPEQQVPDTNIIQRDITISNAAARSPVEALIDTSEPEPVAFSDVPSTIPAMEIPAQRNPQQQVPDASILQQDELLKSEAVKASVEVKAEILEQIPAADMKTTNIVSATKSPAQHDRGWIIPDTPVLQQNELPTGENMKVPLEPSIEPSEAISAMVVDTTNNTLDREMPTQRDFGQLVPDTYPFQKNELSAGDELRVAMEEPAVMAKTPEPATTVIGQNHNPSFAIYHSSDMEAHIQHEPEEANIIQKFAGERMVEQTGNTPNSPETSPEQSVLISNESPMPYAWGQKVMSGDEKRNDKVGIPGKQVSSEVHKYLVSRGVPLGSETHQIRERGEENWQERFTLEQEAEIQPVASNENVRFAQDDEIEIPRWDTAAVERGAWLGTPDLRANETVDMASSVSELPDRISMHMDNLINSNGENSILIQLEPKHLGKIRFRVSLKENKISAKMSVESLETKEIIELQLPDIKQSLLQHDVKITELSVSLNNGSLGSNPRNSGFSNERGDFFDNTGLDRGETYEQGDEHRSNALTGQEITSDGQVNLLI